MEDRLTDWLIDHDPLGSGQLVTELHAILLAHKLMEEFDIREYGADED